MKIKWIFGLVFIPIISGMTDDNENILVKYLLKNNNPNTRPVLQENHIIHVNFSVEITKILAVNDREEYIKVQAWVRQSWVNHLTKWDPRKWNNITQVRVPPELLWIPKLILYNSNDGGYVGGASFYKTHLFVTYTGLTYWFSPATFSSYCKLQSRYFPYDEETCALKFGPWVDSIRKMTVSKSIFPVTTSSYRESSEWVLLDSYSSEFTEQYNCCPDPFMHVQFMIRIKRKPTFEVYNIIVPCLILIANIFFPFYLPPEYGERITLSMTILLAVAVFLQAVSDSLPMNSDSTPILGELYLFIMIETVLSVIFCCVSLVLYSKSRYRKPKPVPDWVKTMFIYVIGKYLHIKRSDDMQKKLCYDHHGEQISLNDISKDKMRKKSSMAFFGSKRQCSNQVEIETYREIRNIRALLLKNENTEDEKKHQADWRYVAKISDRIFFIILLIIVTTTLLAILLPPYINYDKV